MRAADDFADLGGGVYRWEAYDGESKVDLSASAVLATSGLFFIDPIALRQEALTELLQAAAAPLAGILRTNANHDRAAEALSQTLRAPLLSVASGLTAIPLPGAAKGEVAWHRAGDDGGVMIVGDALINLASHPFSFLPDKYCEDPARMRHSLARLLDFPFERLLFAHGEPLMNGAHARLAALLD